MPSLHFSDVFWGSVKHAKKAVVLCVEDFFCNGQEIKCIMDMKVAELKNI